MLCYVMLCCCCCCPTAPAYLLLPRKGKSIQDNASSEGVHRAGRRRAGQASINCVEGAVHEVATDEGYG